MERLRAPTMRCGTPSFTLFLLWPRCVVRDFPPLLRKWWDTEKRHDGSSEYVGMDDTIRRLSAIVATKGPFDGILGRSFPLHFAHDVVSSPVHKSRLASTGFSQGAIVTTVMTGLLESGALEVRQCCGERLSISDRAHSPPPQPLSPSTALLIAGNVWV